MWDCAVVQTIPGTESDRYQACLKQHLLSCVTLLRQIIRALGLANRKQRNIESPVSLFLWRNAIFYFLVWGKQEETIVKAMRYLYIWHKIEVPFCIHWVSFQKRMSDLEDIQTAMTDGWLD